jgi:hypothetical protein
MNKESVAGRSAALFRLVIGRLSLVLCKKFSRKNAQSTQKGKRK